MNIYIKKQRFCSIYRILSAFIAVAFLTTTIVPQGYANTVISAPLSGINLPVPGTMLGMTESFTPVMVKGVTIHPDNPLRFDFIVDTGNTELGQGDALQEETTKLVKYFLAALTVPEKEMWVNLSPYEKDRIIADGLGQTDMGRDMLAQDYLLKQVTASLMYPEEELGEKFWTRVYARAQEEFGTTDIPMNTFNKVWIVPEKAVVFEDEKTSSTYVLESHLKVMLEEDYEAMEHNVDRRGLIHQTQDKGMINHAPTDIIRELLIPEIEKEVNQGKTFANLRQIYNSMILAAWYKQNLKDSLLGKIYMDQNKTKGIDTEDKQITQKIYDQYISSFKKGVYDYIKEDYDSATQQVVPRKYFSGGLKMGIDLSMLDTKKGRGNITRLDAENVGEILKFGYDMVDLGMGSAKIVKIKQAINNATYGDNSMVASEQGLKISQYIREGFDSDVEREKRAAVIEALYDHVDVLRKQFKSASAVADLPVFFRTISDYLENEAFLEILKEKVLTEEKYNTRISTEDDFLKVIAEFKEILEIKSSSTIVESGVWTAVEKIAEISFYFSGLHETKWSATYHKSNIAMFLAEGIMAESKDVEKEKKIKENALNLLEGTKSLFDRILLNEKNEEYTDVFKNLNQKLVNNIKILDLESEAAKLQYSLEEYEEDLDAFENNLNQHLFDVFQEFMGDIPKVDGFIKEVRKTLNNIQNKTGSRLKLIAEELNKAIDALELDVAMSTEVTSLSDEGVKLTQWDDMDEWILAGGSGWGSTYNRDQEIHDGNSYFTDTAIEEIYYRDKINSSGKVMVIKLKLKVIETIVKDKKIDINVPEVIIETNENKEFDIVVNADKRKINFMIWKAKYNITIVFKDSNSEFQKIFLNFDKYQNIMKNPESFRKIIQDKFIASEYLVKLVEEKLGEIVQDATNSLDPIELNSIMSEINNVKEILTQEKENTEFLNKIKQKLKNLFLAMGSVNRRKKIEFIDARKALNEIPEILGLGKIDFHSEAYDDAMLTDEGKKKIRTERVINGLLDLVVPESLKESGLEGVRGVITQVVNIMEKEWSVKYLEDTASKLEKQFDDKFAETEEISESYAHVIKMLEKEHDTLDNDGRAVQHDLIQTQFSELIESAINAYNDVGKSYARSKNIILIFRDEINRIQVENETKQLKESDFKKIIHKALKATFQNTLTEVSKENKDAFVILNFRTLIDVIKNKVDSIIENIDGDDEIGEKIYEIFKNPPMSEAEKDKVVFEVIYPGIFQLTEYKLSHSGFEKFPHLGFESQPEELFEALFKKVNKSNYVTIPVGRFSPEGDIIQNAMKSLVETGQAIIDGDIIGLDEPIETGFKANDKDDLEDIRGIMHNIKVKFDNITKNFEERIQKSKGFGGNDQIRDDLKEFISKNEMSPYLIRSIASIFDYIINHYLTVGSELDNSFYELAHGLNMRIVGIKKDGHKIFVEAWGKHGAIYKWREWTDDLAKDIAKDTIEIIHQSKDRSMATGKLVAFKVQKKYGEGNSLKVGEAVIEKLREQGVTLSDFNDFTITLKGNLGDGKSRAISIKFADVSFSQDDGAVHIKSSDHFLAWEQSLDDTSVEFEGHLKDDKDNTIKSEVSDSSMIVEEWIGKKIVGWVMNEKADPEVNFIKMDALLEYLKGEDIISFPETEDLRAFLLEYGAESTDVKVEGTNEMFYVSQFKGQEFLAWNQSVKLYKSLMVFTHMDGIPQEDWGSPVQFLFHYLKVKKEKRDGFVRKILEIILKENGLYQESLSDVQIVGKVRPILQKIEKTFEPNETVVKGVFYTELVQFSEGLKKEENGNIYPDELMKRHIDAVISRLMEGRVFERISFLLDKYRMNNTNLKGLNTILKWVTEKQEDNAMRSEGREKIEAIADEVKKRLNSKEYVDVLRLFNRFLNVHQEMKTKWEEEVLPEVTLENERDLLRWSFKDNLEKMLNILEIMRDKIVYNNEYYAYESQETIGVFVNEWDGQGKMSLFTTGDILHDMELVVRDVVIGGMIEKVLNEEKIILVSGDMPINKVDIHDMELKGEASYDEILERLNHNLNAFNKSRPIKINGYSVFHVDDVARILFSLKGKRKKGEKINRRKKKINMPFSHKKLSNFVYDAYKTKYVKKYTRIEKMELGWIREKLENFELLEKKDFDVVLNIERLDGELRRKLNEKINVLFGSEIKLDNNLKKDTKLDIIKAIRWDTFFSVVDSIVTRKDSRVDGGTIDMAVDIYQEYVKKRESIFINIEVKALLADVPMLDKQGIEYALDNIILLGQRGRIIVPGLYGERFYELLESARVIGAIDRAMFEMTGEVEKQVNKIKKVGGINLDAAMLDLQIRRDGNGVPLPVAEQDFSTIHIEGVFPVFINATPVSIPLLLGFADEAVPVGCPSDEESLHCDQALIFSKPEEEIVL